MAYCACRRAAARLPHQRDELTCVGDSTWCAPSPSRRHTLARLIASPHFHPPQAEILDEQLVAGEKMGVEKLDVAK